MVQIEHFKILAKDVSKTAELFSEALGFVEVGNFTDFETAREGKVLYCEMSVEKSVFKCEILVTPCPEKETLEKNSKRATSNRIDLSVDSGHFDSIFQNLSKKVRTPKLRNVTVKKSDSSSFFRHLSIKHPSDIHLEITERPRLRLCNPSPSLQLV